MIRINDDKYFAYEMIGLFNSNGEWIHPIRTIDSFELIFVVEGVVYIREEEKEYKLVQNQFIILDPFKQHGGYKKSSDPTSFYWFHFHTNMEIPYKMYSGEEVYDIKYLLKKLLHISKTPSYNKCATDAASLMIYNELISIQTSQSGSSLANKILEYIRTNTCTTKMTVAQIAAHFGYNVDYISKIFKKTFGIAIKDHIVSEKIKYAKDLLLTTNLSVKEISVQLGFKEENMFIKFFMYHDEISPSKFRNKYFNIHTNNI